MRTEIRTELMPKVDVDEVLDILIGLQDNQDTLREAICDTLLALGWPVTKTIIWHLNAKGVFLASKEELDVEKFYEHLIQIIGQAADIVLNEIYEKIRRNGGQNP
ncbi:MAG: hypothetical protein ACREAZ_09965 [Nitrososphaera sp.]